MIIRALLVVLGLMLMVMLISCQAPSVPDEELFQIDSSLLPDVSVSSVNTRKPAEGIVIGFANMADSIEFCTSVKIGLEKECKARGWDIVSLDNVLDGQKAVQNAETLIAQKVDFVVMYNIDASTQPAIADQLKAAKIPAIAIDIYMPDFPFFGVDNAKVGVMGGEWLGNYAKTLENREPDLFVIMDNPMGGQYAKDRSDACEVGLRKVFPDFSDSRIVRVDAKSDVAPAQEAMTRVLDEHPDATFIAVTGINDQVCAGALAALQLKLRDSEAIVCSLGCDSNFLRQLHVTKGEGAWKAAIAFAPELYGHFLVPLIERALSGETLPNISTVHNFIVSKETIAQYYPDYAF